MQQRNGGQADYASIPPSWLRFDEFVKKIR